METGEASDSELSTCKSVQFSSIRCEDFVSEELVRENFFLCDDDDGTVL